VERIERVNGDESDRAQLLVASVLVLDCAGRQRLDHEDTPASARDAG
jgi:hypothetical protein